MRILKTINGIKTRNYFVNLLLNRAGAIALLGIALSGLGGFYSILLYKNLKTDIEELLPTTARSVIDMEEVSTRLTSIESLGVLIFSKDTEASQRFVVNLAERLNKVPKDVISSVEYKIDQELKFFMERKALYMELADLQQIRDYIFRKLEYEKDLYNPLNIFNENEIPEPELDFMALRQKYEKQAWGYERLPEGFYATPDKTIRAVLVFVPGKTSSIERLKALKAAVEESITSLNPATYAPDLVIKYTGAVQDTIEEHEALVADLALSTIIVACLVTLAILLFYRNFRATLALLVSLAAGTLVTFGLAYFVVGYLNANSAFLGSIVIGNGINFGIILLARYLEERRNGISNNEAIRISIVKTAPSTGTAALAAALSYGSLMLTEFRGFNQFGVIGLIGMVLCWISAYTVLPALLCLLDKGANFGKPKKASYSLMMVTAKIVKQWPGVIAALAILLSLLSIGTFGLRMVHSYGTQPYEVLETDLNRLRNRESMEHGSAYLSKYLDLIFQHYLSPVVILPKTREEGRQIAKALKEKQVREGKSSLVAVVQTLDDFIPTDQNKKIEVLRDIARLLPPKIANRLAQDDQKLIKQFLNPQVMVPIRESDLPELILKKFTEKDGSRGNLVLVEPPIFQVTWDSHELIGFINDLRAIADSTTPGTAIAGTIVLTSDMTRAIVRDGPLATVFAFLAVILLVVLLFRNIKTIGLVLLALFLGILWLAGIILGFKLKINFLNFIVLPITFGIGVDYGVNIFGRYKEEGGRGILNVIRHTGGAVALSSFTTIVGYASLLIAGNQGFVSFGRLAVAGEITCIGAAIIALPAFLLFFSRNQKA